MKHLREPEPVRGRAITLGDGIRRIVAPNAGRMTYHGTNTYLVAWGDGTVIVDPGPDDPAHVEAVVRGCDGTAAAILVTHGHHDHVGAAPALAAATGAAVHMFQPDTASGRAIVLRPGEIAFGMEVIHTPGHAADHLCFGHPGGVLFSGDHVMGWSSSTVSPPSGEMGDYLDSLRRLLARPDRLYLPGHGPPIRDPQTWVADLLYRRLAKEAAIVRELAAGPQPIAQMRQALYGTPDAVIASAAERTLTAHLLKLEREGTVQRLGNLWAIT